MQHRWDRKLIFPRSMRSIDVGEEVGVAYNSELPSNLCPALELGGPGIGAIEDRWIEDC
jgi:hypothetical protein